MGAHGHSRDFRLGFGFLGVVRFQGRKLSKSKGAVVS